MRLGLIGAGRLAAHLGLALKAHGLPPVALGARSVDAAAPLAAVLGLAVDTPEGVLARADVVLLAVRDEAIAPLASRLPWQPHHVAVHGSGATALSALAPARRRAGFHPLQLLAHPLPSADEALQAWQSTRVGIEADDEVYADLEQLARALGAVPLRLQPGGRAAYHAAANLAASALLAPLQAACALWHDALGIPEDQAWAALRPLAEGTLRAAQRRGFAGALSGPMARGDVTVLADHLSAMDRETAALYGALMRALLPLARRSGRVSSDDLARLEALLGA